MLRLPPVAVKANCLAKFNLHVEFWIPTRDVTIVNVTAACRPLLSDEMRAFLVSGPQGQKEAQALLAFGGAATVRVQWRRHRDELMNSTPPGRRCWAYWMIERGLSHQPAGERGELRLIKQLDLYRDDAEREFVRKRLAVISAERSHYWHSRVA